MARGSRDDVCRRRGTIAAKQWGGVLDGGGPRDLREDRGVALYLVPWECT